jgi:hypothetical protein
VWSMDIGRAELLAVFSATKRTLTLRRKLPAWSARGHGRRSGRVHAHRPVQSVLVAWWRVVLDELNYDHHRVGAVAGYGAGLHRLLRGLPTRARRYSGQCFTGAYYSS